MNSKELLKIEKDNNWSIKSQNGSHIKLINENFERPIIIPFHGKKEIPRGTANSILKQMGLK